MFNRNLIRKRLVDEDTHERSEDDLVLPPVQSSLCEATSQTQTETSKDEHRYLLQNNTEVNSVLLKPSKKGNSQGTQKAHQQQQKLDVPNKTVAVLSSDGNDIIDLTDETADDETVHNCGIEWDTNFTTYGASHQLESDSDRMVQVQPDKWLQGKRYERTQIPHDNNAQSQSGNGIQCSQGYRGRCFGE